MTSSTDHSREYTPMVIYGKAVKPGVDLKTRSFFGDIGKTVLEYLGIENEIKGNSFLREVL